MLTGECVISNVHQSVEVFLQNLDSLPEIHCLYIPIILRCRFKRDAKIEVWV